MRDDVEGESGVHWPSKEDNLCTVRERRDGCWYHTFYVRVVCREGSLVERRWESTV